MGESDGPVTAVKGIRIPDFDSWWKVTDDWKRAFQGEIFSRFGLKENLDDFKRKGERGTVHLAAADKSRGYVFTSRPVIDSRYVEHHTDQVRAYKDFGAFISREHFDHLSCQSAFSWETRL